MMIVFTLLIILPLLFSGICSIYLNPCTQFKCTGLPSCSTAGATANHPTRPDLYCVCEHPPGYTCMPCPSTLRWNQEKGYCDWPRSLPQKSCPEGWIEYTSTHERYIGSKYCYFFGLNHLTAGNAAIYCNARNAHLTSIWNEDEEKFFLKKIDQYGGQYWWTGGQQNEDGSISWSDESISSYKNIHIQIWGNNCVDFSNFHPRPHWTVDSCNTHMSPYICKNKLT